MIELRTSGDPGFTEDAQTIPIVREFIQQSNNKKIANLAKWIWHVYRRESMYVPGYSESERKRMVIETFFDGTDPRFEETILSDRIIKHYIDINYTSLTRNYEIVRNDVSKMIDHLHNIPFTKKGRYEIDVTGTDGQISRVKVEAEIDNTKEKKDAYDMLEKMLAYQELLEKKLNTENKKKQHGTRLFDSRD